jgi:two-component system, response regulator RegA
MDVTRRVQQPPPWTLPETVLLADPSRSNTAPLSSEFRDLGVAKIWAAEDPNEACHVASLVKPNLVLLELRFGEHTGFDLLRELQQVSPTSVSVVVTAFGSLASTVRALRLGATACLAKPVSAVGILRAIADAASALHEDEAKLVSSHMSLRRAMWEYLNRVFVDSGSVSKAARRLGVDRRSLRRMLCRNAPR